MSNIGIGNLPPGCNPTDFDEHPEQRPINDAGFAISYSEASIAARALEMNIEELDQLMAELKDRKEDTLRWAVRDLIKKFQRRLEEVSR